MPLKNASLIAYFAIELRAIFYSKNHKDKLAYYIFYKITGGLGEERNQKMLIVGGRKKSEDAHRD